VTVPVNVTGPAKNALSVDATETVDVIVAKFSYTPLNDVIIGAVIDPVPGVLVPTTLSKNIIKQLSLLAKAVVKVI
jgi:hypothetical protein